MITHLEPGILECEVKWALESITTNKAGGGDGISIELFQILAAQGTLKSLLQHYSPKSSILRHPAFFTAQHLHPYMTTGKTIALTKRIFVAKVMSLLFNMLSSLVITFLQRSTFLLISWLQSPAAVILELQNKV